VLRHENYTQIVDQNKKFKDFLSEVIQLLPDSNYSLLNFQFLYKLSIIAFNNNL
jgi:hypothetical protein